MSIAIDIDVSLPVEPPVAAPEVPDPPLPVPPGAPTPGLPPPPMLDAATMARLVRAYAAQALGVRAVERVAVMPGAEAWLPRRLDRSRLRRAGRAPAVLVLCPPGCVVASRVAGRAAKASVGAEQASMVWARRPPGRLPHRLTVRASIRQGAATRTVRRSLRVSR